jgi:hypothetical protein
LTVDTSVFEAIFTPVASRREIASDWGVAKSWVDRCVTQRGCPTSSLEEARQWREENARRAPTPRDTIARQMKKQGDTNSSEDKILIPLATAKDIAFSGYDFILGLVDRLPKNAAAQCNPENPQLALAVLESEFTYILRNAHKAYAAWSKVGPQKNDSSPVCSPISIEYAVE